MAASRGDVGAIRRGFEEFEAAGRGDHGVNLAVDPHYDFLTDDPHYWYDWWRVRIRGLGPLLHAERFKEFVRTLNFLIGDYDSEVTEDFDYPLHLACVQGHCSVAELLWKNGVAVDTRNYEQETGLHAACGGVKDLTTIRFLLDTAGADLEARDRYDQTPLHFAARQNIQSTWGKFHAEVINLLLDKGADLEARDRFGKTPLHVACEEQLP